MEAVPTREPIEGETHETFETASAHATPRVPVAGPFQRAQVLSISPTPLGHRRKPWSSAACLSEFPCAEWSGESFSQAS